GGGAAADLEHVAGEDVLPGPGREGVEHLVGILERRQVAGDEALDELRRPADPAPVLPQQPLEVELVEALVEHAGELRVLLARHVGGRGAHVWAPSTATPGRSGTCGASPAGRWPPARRLMCPGVWPGVRTRRSEPSPARSCDAGNGPTAGPSKSTSLGSSAAGHCRGTKPRR